MPELEIILRKIKIAKRKGENRLYILQDIDQKIVEELRNMGYIVLQTYSMGYIDTIVGWKNND